MRWLAMLAGAGLGCLSWGADSVTLRSGGERLAVLIPKLSAASGLSLSVDPSLAGEVMAVSFRGAPTPSAMKLTAAAAAAEWIQQPDGSRRLTRPPALVAKLQAAEDEARLGQINRNRNQGQERRIGVSKSLLFAPPDEELLRMRADERVVWSSRPNQRQRPFSQRAKTAWQKELSSRGANPMNCLALVIGRTFSGGMSLEIQAEIGGTLLPRTNITLMTEPPRAQLNSLPSGGPVMPPLPYAVETADVIYSLTGYRGAEAASAARVESANGQVIGLDTALRNPESFDPMSFAAGPVLIAAAEAKGKPFAAILPDDYFGPAFEILRTGRTADAVLSHARVWGLELTETLEGIALSSAWPLRKELTRIPRTALAKLAQSPVSPYSQPLQPVAGYAASISADAFASQLPITLYQYTLPAVAHSYQMNRANYHALRIFHAIRPGMGWRMGNYIGPPVPVTQPPASPQVSVGFAIVGAAGPQFVYNGPGELTAPRIGSPRDRVAVEFSGRSSEVTILNELSSAVFQPRQALERTLALPFGVPAATRLRLSGTNVQSVAMVFGSGMPINITSAESAGALLGRIEQTGSVDLRSRPRGYFAAESQTWSVTIEFPSGHSQSFSLNEVVLPPIPRVGPPESLPADLLARFNRTRYMKQGTVDPGVKKPPPPL